MIPAAWMQRLAPARRLAEMLQPLADLGVRLWVAAVFFKSGLVKIQSWETTLALFQVEYAVPLLPADLAAWLGTAAELTLPVFLALGLAGRASAAALFVFNVVAVVSYPTLNAAGLEWHQVWGLLLLVTVAHGPGRLSLDHLLASRSGVPVMRGA